MQHMLLQGPCCFLLSVKASTEVVFTCFLLQSDLALLTVAEEAFWTDLRPLEFLTEMPELQVRQHAGHEVHHEHPIAVNSAHS